MKATIQTHLYPLFTTLIDIRWFYCFFDAAKKIQCCETSTELAYNLGNSIIVKITQSSDTYTLHF